MNDHRAFSLSFHLRRLSYFLLLLAMISTGVSTTLAQDAAKDAQKPPTGTGDDADEPAAAPKPAHDSPSVDLDTAWSMLTSATTNAKHPDLRIQGLAALGTLGSSSRAAALITDAMKDPDVDVRTSAVLAAGQTKNRALTTQLRAMLDDHEPQVAVAAASTLWKMGDHSGEDILVAVADGERKATAGLVDSARHTVSTDLHNPSTLAKIGALQGASLLLGPFGFGISAYEYIHKNGGQSARALAIELLAQEKTKPIHDELLSALNDKDVGVRAAALKALGEYHNKPTSAAIANLFYDPKSPVRLAAAAAYLRSTGAVAEVSGPKTSVRRSATKKS